MTRTPLRRTWMRAATSLSLFLGTLGLAPAADAALTCSALPEFVRLFLRSHVRYHDLSPEVRERAIENFVVSLDGSRTLLTEPEAKRLRASLAGIFEGTKKGKCEKLTDAHKEIVRGHERAALFVRDTVNAEGYEIDDTASIVLDPTDRGYPADAAARDELLRSLIHFQMSNYLRTGETLDNAKKLLIHRYELRTKRLADLDAEDLYTAFLDAFASSLDPHSNYYSAENHEDFQISMKLSLEGIGVALSERDGYAVVERIIPGGAADRLEGLTDREREVLTELGRGATNAEISDTLFIGAATVKTHVSNILTKLGLRDRAQAVVFAYESGLITPGGHDIGFS